MRKCFFVLSTLLFFRCTLVELNTTHTYEVINEDDAVIRIIGIKEEQNGSFNQDTIIDSSIQPAEKLHLFSSIMGNEYKPYYYSIGIEECDSVFVYRDAVCIERAVNREHVINGDANCRFFIFEDRTIWYPYRHKEYATEGNPPEVIFFKYLFEHDK